VAQAVFDAQQTDVGCMAGTRVQFLDDASRLVTELGGPHVVWIEGMAGKGKTAIAQSLCRRFLDNPAVILAGTFFCSSAANELGHADAQRIVPTLATLLARAVPSCVASLAAELHTDPDLARKPIRDQVEGLLIKPLGSSGVLDSQIVFIIDAIDQCSDQSQLLELVNALADFKCSAPVKFLITARSMPLVRKSCIWDPSRRSLLRLDSIHPEQVTADIRLFIQRRFESSSTETSWYREDDVDSLATLADGLFVFAVAVVKYILEPTDMNIRFNRLQKVTNEGTATVLTELNQMYSSVFTGVATVTSLDPNKLANTRKVISTILSKCAPLQVKTLADLLGLSPDEVRESLDELHAVVLVPEQDEDGELCTVHQTFDEFVRTHAPPHIRSSLSEGQDALAEGCLRRLEADDLCFNVSRCQSSYQANPMTKPSWVAQSLRYACLHWGHHVAHASYNLDARVNSILRHKLLFWLEVLSVIGEVAVTVALAALRTAASEVCLRVGCVKTRADFAAQSQSSDLSNFVRDAISFIESSREAIEFSPAHIYLSAFPFTPKDSLIVQTFSPHLEGLVNVSVFGLPFLEDPKVNAVAISLCLDGSAIASASSDGWVRAWDADSCNEISAVILDKTSAEFLTMAISADGMIATGSADSNVRLWNPDEPNLAMPPLRGHSSAVRTIAFSADATRLVSGSDDKTICIWEVKPAQLMLGTISTVSPVSSVAFSPDGHSIAAGDASGVLRLYDAERRNVTFTHNCGRDIRSIAYALDGALILAASGNNVVSIDHQKRSQVLILTGHKSTINVIACSPDPDPTSDTDDEFVSSPEPSSSETRSGLSADERLIASGAEDGTIRIWDAKTGERRGSVLQGHIGAVLAVGVSPDGRSIVSAGVDGTARVWNLERVRSLGDQPSQRSLLAKSRLLDGWMVTPSDQRLLWIPPEYRDRIEVSCQSQVIITHRKYAVLDGNAHQLHHGEQWTGCWHAGG